MRSPAKHLAALAAGAVIAARPHVTAAHRRSDNVLRIAMGSPGEAQIRVWDDVAAQFEAANPGTKVEMNYQEDDLYQTIGLPNLLNGRNAPDIYFEWTGERLEQRNAGRLRRRHHRGSSRRGPLAGLFDDATLVALQRSTARPSWSRTRPTSPTSSGTTRQLLADAGVSRRRRGRSCSPRATR